ncbi:MAG: 5-formyltetrahydrofolate cyclo-ligase [Bacteroidales bacterium]|jgi:5-formyltetrahydrofolate cyclo-ligase|nr:5-formyltetrahydrofolate cyclo-ligase [Bacteroidales bacterium]
MLNKEQIRQYIRQKKKNFPEAERLSQSASIWQQIEQMDIFRQTGVILMYWSTPDEVFTHEFIRRWYRKKHILLPAIENENLTLKSFHPDTLKKHPTLNLYEPQGEACPDRKNIRLAIVPGIAFDRERHRTGRGKGYYDRLLPALQVCKIGVGFDFQLLDAIPTEPHDVRMDKIVFPSV